MNLNAYFRFLSLSFSNVTNQGDGSLSSINGNRNPDSRSFTNELESYLDEIVELTKDFSLTDYWQSKREKFPSLFKLFIKYSFIPATSSVAESEFSYTGLIITDRRNRIKPDNVNDIMVARNMFS